MAGFSWDGPCRGDLVGGRFLLGEVIGRGAQSIVFAARDTDRAGDPVAVKILSPQGPRSAMEASHARPSDLLRMRHEAAALSAVGHPAIVGLVHAGIDGSSVFLALEYCSGEGLDQLLASGRVGDPRAVARWGVELCEALALAHDRGILHRDIKPANVVVDQGRVKLLDFGMARIRGLHADLDQGVILGTLPYLPLEAWGMGVHEVDGRADLYALGATLYEALIGRRAFEGDRPATILDAHRAGRPRDPRRIDPDVPRPLAEILLRAMQREPVDRYQSATAMAADLRRVAEGRTRPFVLARRDRATRLAIPRHVGREDQRQRVLEEVDRASLGLGGVVLVDAPPGGGKTRFTSELCEAMRARGALVLGGRCQGLDHDIPFDAAMQCLAHFRAQLPLLGERDREARTAHLRERLGGRADPLLTLAPTLGEPLGAHPLEDDSGAQSVRFVDLLQDALIGTAMPGRPTVILLDDVDRADAATRPLVLRLARSIANKPVLLLVTVSTPMAEATAADSQDLPAFELVGEIADEAPRVTRLSLRPLTEEEIIPLIGSMLGTWSEGMEGLGRWVHRASGGSPSHAVQVVRALEDSGALFRTREAWHFAADRAAETVLPADLNDGIERQLGQLTEATRRLLGAAAHLGAAFRSDHLLRVMLRLGDAPNDVLCGVDRGRDADVLVADPEFAGGRPAWRFRHEQARTRLATSWPEADLPALHRAAAEVLAGGRSVDDLDDARLFTVAHHALGADDTATALPLALRAAERALLAGAWRSAQRLFGAVASRGPRDGAEHHRAVLGQATALIHRGGGGGAVRLLTSALEATTDPADRAEYLLLRARARAGQAAAVEADLQAAAALLDEAWPESDARARRAALAELLRSPIRLTRLRPADTTASLPRGEALRRSLRRDAGCLLSVRRPALALLLGVKELSAALARGDARGAACAAAQVAGSLVAETGRTELAWRLLAQAERLLESDPDPLADGLLAAWRGTVGLMAGRLGEARRDLHEGISLLRRTRSEVDVTGFGVLLGLVLREQGDLTGFRRAMEEAWPGWQETGTSASRAALGLACDALLCGDPGRALDWATPAVDGARADCDWRMLAVCLGHRAQMHVRAGLKGAAVVDAREVAMLVRDHSLRGWLAAEARIVAARACLDAGYPEEARRLLPARRELRGFDLLGLRRDAVAGQIELVGRGSTQLLQETATSMAALGMRFDAAQAWAELHARTGRTGTLEETTRALAGCTGVGTTSLVRRLGGQPNDTTEIEQTAGRIAARLGGVAASTSSPMVAATLRA